MGPTDFLLLSAGVASPFVATFGSPDGCLRVARRVLPRFIWAAETNQPAVALTFDDGPDPTYTPQLLRLLEKQDVHATFFLIGRRARRHPELVRAIRDGGHEIGNHGDHPGPVVGDSLRAFREGLLRTEHVLELGDTPVKYYRPGCVFLRPDQRRVAESLGYQCVLGSAFAFDCFNPPPGYIAWAIRPSLRPGAIVALHDAGGDRSATLVAVPRILADARERGLACVRLSELCGRTQPVQPGVSSTRVGRG